MRQKILSRLLSAAVHAAALGAARAAVFYSATRGRQPVASWTTITYRFRLE